MNTEFFDAIEALEKERGIPKEYMLERVEAALVTAYRRESGGQINTRVELDPKTRTTRMFKQLSVVEDIEDDKNEITLEEAQKISPAYNYGDIVEVEIEPKSFGRISAQTAKQVIIQAIREAERGMLIKEYESKKDEIVSALVIRVDPMTDNATLEIGKNEMVLFRHEQISGESLRVGDRIKVFVTEIKQDTKGPSVVLSRTHPGMLKRLFELEVPEIAEGKVEIMSVAREAGSRTKIAVRSNDPAIDPIGACIGPRRIRKTNISDELSGEKIDIIKYSDTIEEFIAASLAPAKVESVIKRTDGDNAYRVIVADDQLSLAIGKAGQNARLASKLVGCKIDIKSESWLDEKPITSSVSYSSVEADIDEEA